MITPPASWSQMVHNSLTNRAPVRCAVCDRYVATFAGLPVVLDDRAQIMGFAHPGCCAPDEAGDGRGPGSAGASGGPAGAVKANPKSVR